MKNKYPARRFERDFFLHIADCNRVVYSFLNFYYLWQLIFSRF